MTPDADERTVQEFFLDAGNSLPVTACHLHHKSPRNELIWTIAGYQDEHPGWNLSRLLLLRLAREN